MAGKNRRSASMMWPGGVFPYKNITPFYTESWNPQVSWYHRVDIVSFSLFTNFRKVNVCE